MSPSPWHVLESRWVMLAGAIVAVLAITVLAYKAANMEGVQAHQQRIEAHLKAVDARATEAIEEHKELRKEVEAVKETMP
jgi:hypothetical protein